MSLEPRSKGRLGRRSAAAAREGSPADFGKRLRLDARPGLGSARYLCRGQGGRMAMNCPIMRGEAAVPGAGWLSDAPAASLESGCPRLALPSAVPGGK